jgi:predicted NBD/HSP70 family sugar kinase
VPANPKEVPVTRQRVSLVTGTSKGVLFDLIRSQGPISRVQLADETGLTPATVSTLVRQLIVEGIVVETGRGESTGGRMPALLDVDPTSRFAVGLQLGSESVTYVVVNVVGGIHGRVRTTGVGASNPQEAVEFIAHEVNALLEGLGIKKDRVVGVGVVAPGPQDLARGVLLGPPHLSTWNDVSIRSMLTLALGLPVLLDNDATAAALGDFWGGELGDTVSHATVYMGSGIGSGILVDGTVFRGASSNAGELGHMIVPSTEGEARTLESVADPSAVIGKAMKLDDAAERFGLDGLDEFEAFAAIARAAAHGDDAAIGLLEESAGHLATAIIGMANLFDLDSVSLAGPAFAVAGPIYIRVISERLNSGFFARARHGVRVKLSGYVSDAAAVGAAALVLQTYLSPRTMGIGMPGSHGVG